MGKFSDGVKKAAGWTAEEWKRQAQKDRERHERDMAAVEERRHRKAATLKCTYSGGTSGIPGLVRGDSYQLRLDNDGIRVSGLLGKPALELAWEDVLDVEVADASRTEIKSRVSHHQAGGLATPLFTTAPVAKVRSKFVGQSYLTIETENYRQMFLVPAAGEELKGRLLVTESKRMGKPAAVEDALQANAEAFDQLKKLGELRESGVLTDEEFEAKKREILARI